MKNHLRFSWLFVALFVIAATSRSQTVPELLYYKFDGTGTTSVPNLASSPVGTNPAPIVGGLTQGGTGQFGAALIGNGSSSGSHYVNTGWATNLSGSWTISFWVSNIAPSSTLYYIWGDVGASSFRCFTNGVAGANNWMMRGGGLTDVLISGAATVAPHQVTIVFDGTGPEVRAYVDGVLNNTVSQGAVTILGSQFKVGAYSSSTNLASGGLMDEFRIFNRALTPAEVSLIWNKSLPLSTAPNDAGVASIDSPQVFCDGNKNIWATIQNYGKNQINPVTVNWTYKGVLQTPVTYSQTLDTFGGSLPYKAQIMLGSKTFVSGQLDDIVAWTTNPNGVTDTSNANDTTSGSFMPSMNGNYTIDPFGSGSSNYVSFSDAAQDLKDFGVCGPVTFNVVDGTYNEQIEIGKVTGVSETNTITFQPDPNNTNPVDVSFAGSSSNNYVLYLNGASYVTFDGINLLSSGSYCTAVRYDGSAQYNTVKNAELTGPATASTSTNSCMIYSNGSGNANNVLSGNHIYGGSYGMYYRGSSSVDLVPGIVVENNIFEDQYYRGMYFYYTDGLKIIGNKISSSASYTSGYGIYSYYGDNGIQVVGNQILSMNSEWPRYGMYVYYSDNSDTARGIVANNMVHVGSTTSTGTMYGMNVYGNTYTDVVYNTVVMESSGTSARAGYLYSGSQNTAYNNNFLNYGNGYAVYTLNGNFKWGNNNLATSGSNLAYYSGTVADINAWKASSGDTNSINVNNIYPNPDSLRTCSADIYRKGKAIAAIMPYDFDGDMRQPDTTNIGADAYISNAGDFSIGDTIEFCGGSELEIGTTMNDGTFSWSTGASTPTIIVTEEGNYTVTVDGPCATGMVDDVEVVDVNPVANFVIEEGQFIGGFTNTSEYGTTYHWDFGDGTTSTEINPWHEYPDNGPYTVTLTVMNYCDTVTFSQQVQFSVGLNEITFGSRVNVYPNPATNIINLAFGNIDDQNVQVELIDMRGQQISNLQVKATQNSVERMDVSSLPKGVYLIRLTTTDEVATKQVIVQ